MRAKPTYEELAQRVKELEKETGTFKHTQEMLRKYHRKFRMLIECNHAVVHSNHEAGLLSEVCRIIVEEGGYRLAWVGYAAEQDNAKTVRPVAQMGYEEGYLETLNITWADAERGRGPTGTAIRTGDPCVARNIQTDPNFSPWRKAAVKRGYASSVALPLPANDQIFGALNIYASEPDAFDAEELNLVMELANDLAYGILVIRAQEELKTHRDHLQRLVDMQTEKVRAERDKAQNYLDIAGVIIVIVNADHKVSLINKKGCEIFGYQQEEIIDKNWFEIFLPERCKDEAMQVALSLFAGDIGEEEYYEWPIVRKDGNERIIAWNYSALQDDTGKTVAILSSGEDITERKKVEKALHKTHAFLQSVIDGVTESIMVIDTDFRIKLSNKAAHELNFTDLAATDAPFCYQATHQRTKPCSGVSHPCPLREVLVTKEACSVIHTHTTKNGLEYPVELFASPIFDENGEVTGIIEVGRDISARLRNEQQRKRLEERLFQQQKDRSIATLADGISHDFNNILTAVIGNAELLQKKMGHEKKCNEMLQIIIGSGRRMTELTRQLLAYAKGGKYREDILSLNIIIEQALGLTHKGKAAAIEVIRDLANDLWSIAADHSHMEQVLINIFTNAFEALEKNGGRLTVTTENITRKEDWTCKSHEIHPAGDYIYVLISDTGPGIPPEIQKSIFEPFFSTKFIGRGLGLAAAAGIIRKHDGCIQVESAPDVGASFHLFLPRAKEKEKAETVKTETAKRVFNGKILVIDDESDVLTTVKEIVSLHGFDVLTADSGLAALEIMKRLKNDIEMIILDIQMPGADGKEVFTRIKSINPDIMILVFSGYDKYTALEGINLDPQDGYLQKPSSQKSLINEVLRMTGRE